MSENNREPGLCECGCGGRANVASRSRGAQKGGRHNRFIFGHQRRLKTAAWIEIDMGHKTPCWVWQRKISQNGYGQIRRHRATKSAHRVLFEDANGPVPEGMHLDHLCRVRACVRPDHMEAVTCAENIRRGSRAKLTMEAVRQIRIEYSSGGVTQRSLAKSRGVNQTTIGKALRGVYWNED